MSDETVNSNKNMNATDNVSLVTTHNIRKEIPLQCWPDYCTLIFALCVHLIAQIIGCSTWFNSSAFNKHCNDGNELRLFIILQILINDNIAHISNLVYFLYEPKSETLKWWSIVMKCLIPFGIFSVVWMIYGSILVFKKSNCSSNATTLYNTALFLVCFKYFEWIIGSCIFGFYVRYRTKLERQ